MTGIFEFLVTRRTVEAWIAQFLTFSDTSCCLQGDQINIPFDLFYIVRRSNHECRFHSVQMTERNYPISVLISRKLHITTQHLSTDSLKLIGVDEITQQALALTIGSAPSILHSIIKCKHEFRRIVESWMLRIHRTRRMYFCRLSARNGTKASEINNHCTIVVPLRLDSMWSRKLLAIIFSCRLNLNE